MKFNGDNFTNLISVKFKQLHVNKNNLKHQYKKNTIWQSNYVKLFETAVNYQQSSSNEFRTFFTGITSVITKMTL